MDISEDMDLASTCESVEAANLQGDERSRDLLVDQLAGRVAQS